MYKILVVDDEPRVSIGIRNFLLASDLSISCVETALNGFEAIDYLRMDSFDLVLTDIQMSRMSGIELMETIYLEQPSLPVIVISAHEKFDFAMKSLRLGARDYLVKPVDQEDLLRVVRSVLLEKEELGRRSLEQTIRQQSEAAEDPARRQEILMELVTERGLSQEEQSDLLAELGAELAGPCFAIVLVRMDLRQGGFSNREVMLQGRKLLKYAALNLLSESLAAWNGITFNGFGNELIGIIQIHGPDSEDPRRHSQSQLHLVAQCVSMNLRQYLNVDATIGMSSLRGELALLPKLMEEANMAVEWKRLHPEQRIFHYEDIAAQDSLHMVEWIAKVEICIGWLKEGAEELPQEGIAEMADWLRRLGRTDELVRSYFSMLVYRVYGLLLEYGQASNASLRRFDPELYYKGMAMSDKLARLSGYLTEAAHTLRLLAREREQTILSRIMSYIRQHYRNPALKIQDIAGSVHFSSAYLGYLFKKETKQNVWDYVTELRIEEAKQLLAATDKKRYEIAYEVGYESPEHFSRMFKRYTGASPADYRKDSQGGAG